MVLLCIIDGGMPNMEVANGKGGWCVNLCVSLVEVLGNICMWGVMKKEEANLNPIFWCGHKRNANAILQDNKSRKNSFLYFLFIFLFHRG